MTPNSAHASPHFPTASFPFGFRNRDIWPSTFIPPSVEHPQLDVPPTSADSFSGQDGYAAFMGRLETAYPEWFDNFSRADAGIANRLELTELMVCAPHPFLAGLVYGKLTERVHIACITGRAF